MEQVESIKITTTTKKRECMNYIIKTCLHYLTIIIYLKLIFIHHRNRLRNPLKITTTKKEYYAYHNIYLLLLVIIIRTIIINKD